MRTGAAQAAIQPDLGANQEGDREDQFLSVRVLAREASKIVDQLNLPISGSRTRKLVRQFVREGRADANFRTWFISYADPTGETAVRNVLREKRQA